jgi:iduronate 2-sulfatase
MNPRLTFLALLLFSAFPLSAETNAAKPNVLLICVDDLKPLLGCYGDTHAKTPNLEALAARSQRLDRAYCNQAVCSPSRNALMTGLRPQTLGIYDLPTNFRKSRPDAITVTQYFKQHGYRTEAMGKIMHVGHGNGEDTASWTVPHFKPKATQYALPENSAPKPEKKNTVQPWKDPRGAATESADVPDDTYADGQIALEAVRRLKAAKESGDPFFMGVGFLKPHLPFIAPKKYWDMHDPATLPQPDRDTAPEGAPDFAGQTGGELRQYKGIPGGKEPIGPDLTRHLIHGYYAATSYMDAQLGLVLAALDETGLANNTIVILWGDHGWHLGDHGIWCKHTNFEQAARIPLMLALPGKTGTVSSALVETVDLYPTLVELAGLPAAPGLDGKSFAPLLEDAAAPHRDHAIHVYPRNKLLGRAIRTDRHRLVEWKEIGADPTTAEWELYDYETDPGETKNLASAKPEVVKELRAILATHPEAKAQIKSDPPASSGKPVTKPKSASQDRSAMFRKRDTNGDGKLSREEFLLNQPDPDEAPKRFPVFDANKDGVLSEEEFVKGGKVTKP